MTLYNNFLLKRGVGLFSRVGLISGDYGNCVYIIICVIAVHVHHGSSGARGKH